MINLNLIASALTDMLVNCEASGSGDKLSHYKTLAYSETLPTFLVLPINEDYIWVDITKFFLSSLT